MQYYNRGSWHTIPSSSYDRKIGDQRTTRIDDVFGSLTFTAYLELGENIPPYTVFLNGSDQYVGKSKITQYIAQTGLYVHEIELLDAAAFLKCFIMGIKVYSKESDTWSSDADKVKSLIDQAARMYPDYTWDYGASIDNRITTSKTYTFSATDTLFDCLNKIYQENDCKVFLEFEDNSPTYLKIKAKPIISGFYDLTDPDLRITEHTEDQDSENYGRYLETYASNVVDRNTITRLDYVQAKADDILLNADTAKIFIPTPIEEIKDFGIRQTRWDGNLIFKGLNNFFSNNHFSPTTRTYGWLATNIQCTINGQTIYFFDYVFDNEIKQYFPDVTKTDFYQNVYFDQSQPDWVHGTIEFVVPAAMKGKFTKLNAVLEKTQWDVLDPAHQAESLFYTIGGNTIENLNGSYKNDFWNSIIGTSRGNFLTEFIGCSHYMFSNQLEIEYSLDYSPGVANNLLDMVFFVDYTAITNPYIRNTKTVACQNETLWKPISRSYGVSDNYIDFDKLLPNMTITNNTLGQVEKVYELDLSYENRYEFSSIEAGNAVRIVPNGTDAQNWYISSCIITTKYGGGSLQSPYKKTALITLVRTYSKKAEAIGVDTQSESTNNPLHGIVTRPIYLETTINYSALENNNLYLKFKFYDTNNVVITNTNYDSSTITYLYARCSIQKSNNDYLIYCDTLDQIIFDYQRGSGNGNVTQTPLRYTKPNAEAGYVEIILGTISLISGYAANLPCGDNINFHNLISFNKIKIDKDAREHLTFSILIKGNS